MGGAVADPDSGVVPVDDGGGGRDVGLDDLVPAGVVGAAVVVLLAVLADGRPVSPCLDGFDISTAGGAPGEGSGCDVGDGDALTGEDDEDPVPPLRGRPVVLVADVGGGDGQDLAGVAE